MRLTYRLFLVLLLTLTSLIMAPTVARSQSCCTGLRGNISQTGTIDLTDLSLLIGYLTGPGVTLPCPEAANVSGTGSIDLTDLSLLIRYLTVSAGQGGITVPATSRSQSR